MHAAEVQGDHRDRQIDLCLNIAGLSHSNTGTVFDCCDLRQALKRQFIQDPNLIFASYSLHHFSVPQQADVVADCFRAVSPGGTFVWIDLQRDERETRDAYLRRFHDQLLKDWAALTESQVQEVIDHMKLENFPVSNTEKCSFARNAGFTEMRSLYENHYYAAHALWKTDAAGPASALQR